MIYVLTVLNAVVLVYEALVCELSHHGCEEVNISVDEYKVVYFGHDLRLLARRQLLAHAKQLIGHNLGILAFAIDVRYYTVEHLHCHQRFGYLKHGSGVVV